MWKVRQSDFLAQLDQLDKTASGEINETAQSAVVGQATFIEGVYEAWARECKDRKTIIYALNIAHAEAIADLFSRHGVPTWVIHSKLPPWKCSHALAEFSRGNGVIVNVGILTIGSDIPSTTAIILARRTMSAALFFQIVGRGSRLYPGKTDCLILDLAGNALIHGIDPDNPVIEVQEDERKPRIKICPMCETVSAMRAAVCKECGFQFPVEPEKPEDERRQTAVEDAGAAGDLVEFKGFRVEATELVTYRTYRAKLSERPTVECAYLCGRRWIRQWLCPQHDSGTFPQKKAKWYWYSLGGRKPCPKSVTEWLERQGELTQDVLVTLDESGRYPVVKKVERNEVQGCRTSGASGG